MTFNKGRQVDYVLSEWNDEEKKTLQERLDICHELIKSFGTCWNKYYHEYI